MITVFTVRLKSDVNCETLLLLKASNFCIVLQSIALNFITRVFRHKTVLKDSIAVNKFRLISL